MKIGYEAKRVFHNKTGLGNYSRDLIRILSFYFPDNEYYLYNPKNNRKALFVPNNLNVFEKKPIGNFYKKFKNIWRQFGIIQDLKANNIKLFHGLSGELPVGLMKNNIKSVVTIHDLIFVRYPELYSYFDRKIHFFKFRKAAQNSDLIIAISEQTKQDIITYLKVDPYKIRVIYQGCQDVFKKTYSEEFKNSVLKKFNISKNYILNVGTIEERKNALSIVKAIKDLEIDLVLIGKQKKYAEVIHKYISENKLENKVHFIEGLTSEELAVFYQKAQIFIYPSIFEGFGIPIIEALFSKTPVITTNSGVFPEAGGPFSYYVNPKESEDIKNKIEWIFNNPEVVKENVLKSFDFVQKFTDEKIANDINKVYQELV